MKDFKLLFFAVTLSVFVITVIAERILIPILKSHKVGQKILDIGPRWHKNKEGTPAMGGIGFILASLLVMTVFFAVKAVQGESANYIPLALTLGFGVANGAVGFVDDYIKLVKKQNEGLTRMQKLVLQFVMAIAYVTVMAYTGCMDTVLDLPFTDRTWDLGIWYDILAVIVLVGVVNGGNITDGIDGLASTVTFGIGGFYALWAFSQNSEQLSLLAAILIGSALGFLVYNAYPARVFMGDTGSLFFGALAIGSAFMMNNPIIGLFASAVFILEMFSSFLQIFVFHFFHGKRLFKMAPIHHHFEQCGWSELTVVLVFFAVEVCFCVLGWFAL